MAHPVSIYVNTFGTGVASDDIIAKVVEEVFDFRPLAIINNLRLDRPIYRNTSNYGHFGRKGFPWEETDKVDELKATLSKYRF